MRASPAPQSKVVWSGAHGPIAPAVVAATLLMTGCVSGHRPRSTWPTDYDVSAAIERLVDRAERPLWFDGTVRIRGRHRGQRLGGRMIVIVEPDRFYLESIGRLTFVLASDGDEMRVLLARSREWLRTPADAASVEALIGLPVEPSQLGALLSGIGAPAATLRSARHQGAGRLEIEGGWLQLDASSGDIVEGAINGLRFRAQPAERTIRLVVEASEIEIELLRRKSRGGSDPGPDLFQPQPPDGFEELELWRLRQPVLLPGDDS